jgi:hypothetical protein
MLLGARPLHPLTNRACPGRTKNLQRAGHTGHRVPTAYSDPVAGSSYEHRRVIVIGLVDADPLPGQPFEHGMLDVGDGQRPCWELRGNPAGVNMRAVAMTGTVPHSWMDSGGNSSNNAASAELEGLQLSVSSTDGHCIKHLHLEFQGSDVGARNFKTARPIPSGRRHGGADWGLVQGCRVLDHGGLNFVRISAGRSG